MAVAPLQGKTIAITEARRATELASLITKLGGIPYSTPAVREVPCQDRGPALAALDQICRGEVQAAIFLTGVGTRALLGLAADAGRRDAFLQVLQEMFVVARGPKPVAALREAGVRIDLTPKEPTSEGILNALEERGYALSGKRVAVQRYGEENPFLVEGLSVRGAIVIEIPLYEWALPEDQGPLVRLIHDLLRGGIDILAVTSSPQVKHLFAVAEQLGLRETLARALRDSVTVAVVGPVSEAALVERGIIPRVRSDKPTMGGLIHAIADYLSVPEEGHARA